MMMSSLNIPLDVMHTCSSCLLCILFLQSVEVKELKERKIWLQEKLAGPSSALPQALLEQPGECL